MNRPAPINSSRDTVTWATTRDLRSRACPVPVTDPAWLLSVGATSGLVAFNAGTSPNSSPVMSATAKLNSRMRPSGVAARPSGVAPCGRKLSIAFTPAYAMATPATPPVSASSTLSTSSWRTICPRPAPSARRTAISRWRPAARTSRRLATLPHAISNTSATMPMSTPSGRAIWLRRKERPVAAGMKSIVDLRNSWRSCSEARAICGSFASCSIIWWNRTCIDALPCCGVTPGFSRPTIWSQALRRSFHISYEFLAGHDPGLHRDRNEQLGDAPRLDAVEPACRHSDDGEIVPVHHHVPVEDGWIAGEPVLPVAVAQHHHGVSQDGGVVIRRNGAAHRRADAQHGEVGPRYHLARSTLRAAAETHADRRGDTAQDAAERLVPIEEVPVHRVGKGILAAVASEMTAMMVQQDELSGVLHRQQAQHELVDEGEDRGVGANAQSQRQHNHCAEYRGLRQIAKGEADVRDRKS